MDPGIVEAHRAQGFSFSGTDVCGIEGQRPGVLAQRERSRVEVRRLPIVVLGVVGKLFWGALGTEVV